ncbi:MAG: hypothetical protein QXY45_04265 [Candidatus Aenigmatarchaeota archaeon]
MVSTNSCVMRNSLLLILVFCLLLIPLVFGQNTVCIYFFYGETCPHCAQEKPFLEEMKSKYPIELHSFEVYFNDENRELFKRVTEIYGIKASGVPTTFIGEKVFVGYSEENGEVYDTKSNSYVGYRSSIEKTIKEYSESGGAPCPSIDNNNSNTNNNKRRGYLIALFVILIVVLSILIINKMYLKTLKKKIFLLLPLLLMPSIALSSEIRIPILGKLNTDLPLPLLGAILGFIDGGFNPCALSVLIFLIAYLMGLGSKRKVLLIGLTYSLMIFLTYFIFMFGAISVLSIIGYISIVKKIVGFIIIFVGIVEIKDFFWYGRWFSLEIPKFAKPTIEKLTKSATLTSAIILGFFVSVVEIPCAGAFPFVYLTILSERVQTPANILYLLWYNLFFVLPLIILTLIFYFGLMKVEKVEETRLKLRKYMRLLSGLIMVGLGIALFINKL